jgi:hypothetical protein
MNAYLIDPLTRTVTPLALPDGNVRAELDAIYTAIGCNNVDAVRLDYGDGIFVDDEGLISGNPDARGYFALAGYPNPLCGRGVCIGSDAEGDSTSPRITLEALTALVLWVDPAEARDMLQQSRAAVAATALAHGWDVRGEIDGVGPLVMFAAEGGK